MTFLKWVMLAGLVAVIIPILLHLLNRRQVRAVIWGAMHFLFGSMQRRRRRILLEGDVPSPSNPPSGCPFHTRCPYPKTHPEAMERCRSKVPSVQHHTEGHTVTCHFYEEIQKQGGPQPTT